MIKGQRRRLTPDALGLEGTFPVTVLTGFLGSGKTTLLTNILNDPRTANTAVIINELGEVGLDNLLVQSPIDETVLLENGCVCCTMIGDLSATLQEMIARRVAGDFPPFERVVVETTGTADPEPLVKTLVEDDDVRTFYHLDGVVTVVDAHNGSQQLDTHFQSIKQIAVADLVLLSKIDLTDPERLESLKSRINQLNPGVPVEGVDQGKFDALRVLGSGFDARAARGADVDGWLSEAACEAVGRARAATVDCEYHQSSGDHTHHHHHDAVQTFSIRRPGAVHPAGLKLWVDLVSVLQGPGLLRVKGLVNVMERPVVINFVQRACHPPVELDAWPSDDHSTRIVFITHGLARADLESTLQALDFEPVRRAESKAIDPSDYRRFTGILERFRTSQPD